MKIFLQNVGWLGLSAILGKVLLMATFAIGARALGPESWGVFAYAFALYHVIQILSDFGFHPLIQRRVASGNASLLFLKKSIRLRIILGLIGCVVVTLVVWKDAEMVGMVAILGISILFRSYYATIRSATQGLERMGFTAILDVALYGGFLGFSVIGLFLTINDPLSIAYAWLLGSAIAFIAAREILLKKIDRHSIWKNTHTVNYKFLLMESFPFIFANVILILFHQADIFILEYYRDDEEVGLYFAAYNIFNALILLPGLISVVLYPKFVRKQWVSKGALFKLVAIVFSLTCVLTIFVGLSSHYIVSIVYGEQYGSIESTVFILALGAPFVAMTSIVGHRLYAMHKEYASAFMTGISVVINIVLNIYYIPKYGMIAAAWVTSATLAFDAFIHIMYIAYLRIDPAESQAKRADL